MLCFTKANSQNDRGSTFSYSGTTTTPKLEVWFVSNNYLYNLYTRDKPSTGAFSGIAGCTPSIASQWQTIPVSSGAFGKGASITYSQTEIWNIKRQHTKSSRKCNQITQ